MNAMKKSSTNTWAILVLLLSIFIWACTCPTCPSPNPLISVDEDGIYSVKTDSVPGANTVDIIISSAQGQPLDTATLNIGDSHLLPYNDETLYPLQLKFFYKSSTGSFIAEDQLRLGYVDPNSGGVTAMDIIMGAAPPDPAPIDPPECPVTTQIATGTNEVVFSWEPDDYFEVIIVKGANTQKIGIQTKEAGEGQTLGKVHVYRGNVYPSPCLTTPNYTISQSLKACTITVATSPAASCVVSGDDGSTRIVRITGSGSSFTVKKYVE